jgi:preprotein translocase subunit YajC
MIKFLQAAADTVQVVATELTDVATDAAQVDPTFFEKYGNWILIGAMIVIFYFFMIRPQQKARKKEQEMRDSLKAGDKIMTIGGIHGVIKKVEEDSFLIEVDSNVTLRLAKQAVTPVQQISK